MNFSESRISFGFRSGVDNTSQSSLGPIQHNSSQGNTYRYLFIYPFTYPFSSDSCN